MIRRLALSSLRTRLLLLVMLALVPALALIVYTASVQRRLATASVKQDAMRVAKSAAADQERLTEGARQLLTALAQFPAVRARDSSEASALFAKLHRQYPFYANLVAFEPDGDLFASALPAKPHNVGDVSTFQRALQTRNFVIGDYVIGRITHIPVVDFGYPVLNDAGRVLAVLHAPLSLAWLNQRAVEADLPPGSILVVIDQSGTVLARYPDPEKWIGQPMPEASLAKLMLTQQEGTAEAPGSDGISRLWAFVPLRKGAEAGGAYLSVGIPRAVAYSGVNALLTRNLAVLGGVAALVFLVAWFGGDAFILRRVRALVRATRRLGTGDLTVRTGLAYEPDELGQLARNFDQMASSLEQLTRRHELILSAAGEGIVGADREGNIVFANPAAARLLGYDVQELIGRNAHALTHHSKPDGTPYPAAECPFSQTQKDGVVRHVTDEVFWRKDGTSFSVEYVSTPLWIRGEKAGTVCVFKDVTYRKQAEAALRASEERYRLLIEAVPQIVWLADLDGMITYVNQRWHEYSGIPPEETYGTGWTRGFHPDDLPQLLDRWTHALQSGEPYATEARLRRGADGVYRWHLVRGLPVCDAAGQIVQWIGTTTDIHDHKQSLEVAEEARRQARQLARQLRLITDAVPALISFIDRDYRFRLTNGAYEEWFGLNRDQIPGRHVWEVVGDENWAQVRPYAETALAGEKVQFEALLKRQDGSRRWVDATFTPFRNEAGEVEGIVVLSTNIAERKRREEAERLLADASKLLGASLDYEETLRNLARLMVPRFADWCIIDLVRDSGTYQRLQVEHRDPAKKELAYELGRRFPISDRIPKGIVRVIRDGESQLYPEVPADKLEHAIPDPEHLRILRQLGLRSLISVPLIGHGRTFGALTLVRGENDQLYDQQDLELVQELASRAAIAVENARLYREVQQANQTKDEFLAMLAHELRNPLGAVSNALHVMQHADPQSAGYRRAEEIARRQIEHQTRLVNDLLDVSRIQRNKIDLHLEPLDLVRVVRESVEDQWGALDEAGLRVRCEFPEQPVPVLGDRTRLAQVLGNLLDNSRKFTPAGGAVEVRVIILADSQQTQVVVRDTGIGISPALLPRIFEPFIQADRTLARERGGLGLGLALVKGLVDLHGGTIRAESSGNGQGATFTITLPIRTDLSLPGTGTSAQTPFQAPLRVLVIEDLPDAAETLQDLLELSGYEVWIAHSGGEGLDIARTFRPDVIICDIGLPEMSGYEVAARIREHPDTAQTLLIALTGYGAASDIEQAHTSGFDLHLTKPIQPETLEQILAEMQERMRRKRQGQTSADLPGAGAREPSWNSPHQ